MAIFDLSAAENHAAAPVAAHRSRPLAGLFALALGTLGLHRLYLRASWWWVYPMLALPLMGWALRAEPWFRHPGFFGFSLIAVICMAEAIVISLTPDARWDERHNARSVRQSANRWAPVIIAVLSLIVAAMLGMSVMAIALEGWFNARLGR